MLQVKYAPILRLYVIIDLEQSCKPIGSFDTLHDARLAARVVAGQEPIVGTDVRRNGG